MQHLQTVQEIFQDKLFRIPDYQRGYAWEPRHWQDMLDDIELLEDHQEHYTGTLVIYAVDGESEIYDDDGNVFARYDVVDGQQRLTTLSILLHVISLEFEHAQGKRSLSAGIRKRYICTKREDDDLPKLRLNSDTDTFYRRNIISRRPAVTGAKILSEQRLARALEYFTSYFETKRNEHGEEYLGWLEQTYMKVCSKMKLTVYVVPMASEVGVIFEVMNNRGKHLTELEKVKNYLLYLTSKVGGEAEKELAEEINGTWTHIFESLMAAKSFTNESDEAIENQMLRCHWLFAYDYSRKNWSGSQSVKTRFHLRSYRGRPGDLRNDVRQYVRLLKECCTAYVDLIAPARSDSFSCLQPGDLKRLELVEWTQKLIRIDALASFLPLLIAVRIRYSHDLSVYQQFLEIAEKYTFRVYRYAEKRPNAGQTSLYKAAHDLFHDNATPESAYAYVQSLLHVYAPEKDFISMTDEISGRNWYAWNGLKYLLYEYESKLAKGRPVRMDWTFLKDKAKESTIEHILPRTPTVDYWQQHWSQEDIALATNDIGNLVLTFDNSAYSNKSFPDKKGNGQTDRCYANSSLFMERRLARYDDWGMEQLRRRRKEIAQWIKERWYVDGGSLVIAELLGEIDELDELDDSLPTGNGDEEVCEE